MKKLVSLILALAMVLCMVSFASADETYRVAMITDSGDITDQSFNQTTYEACKAFCEANGVDFNYFKPTGDSTRSASRRSKRLSTKATTSSSCPATCSRRRLASASRRTRT